LKFFEYEAKQIFAKYQIPIPQGILITDLKQIKDIATKLSPPYVIKAQILSGGRQKAGGILFVDNVEEVQEETVKLMKGNISSVPIDKVIIEEKIEYNKELFLGITVDRFNRTTVVVASLAGGVDVEKTAVNTPQAIIKTLVDPHLGIRSFHATAIARKMGYNKNRLVELSRIILQLYHVLIDCDAEQVEINPLVETNDGKFIALDARMTIDDNAMFRHKDFQMKNGDRTQRLSLEENLALQNNLVYVKLDGDIGIIGNGAGLVMATLDMINHFGGKPANFLDLGGGASLEQITAALEILISDANVQVFLLNIIGGITHCNVVADAIVKAAKSLIACKPFVVRLEGTNEEEGKRILSEAEIKVFDNMEQASQQAVKLAREQSNGHNN
jgi:succinyl-CoA synthetase beta subunit